MIDAFGFRVTLLRWRLRQLADRLGLWVGYHCPAWLRYWITLDACTKATSGPYGSDHPDDVTIPVLLERTAKAARGVVG